MPRWVRNLNLSCCQERNAPPATPGFENIFGFRYVRPSGDALVFRKNDFLLWCWPVFGRQNDEKYRVLFFTTGFRDASRIIPGVFAGTARDSRAILMEALSHFTILMFFKIRFKNGLVPPSRFHSFLGLTLFQV